MLNSERSRQWLGSAIDQARDRFHFELWAYVIMPEHVHLLVYPLNARHGIEVIRAAIKRPVAKNAVDWLSENDPEWLNRITVRKGIRSERRFWQKGAGYDRNVTSSKALQNIVNYIHMNPVRRGHVQRAVDWKWSSASFVSEQRPGPIEVDRILSEWWD
ncbi:Transposase IS200 like protein [Stratiformator vulcanicus]|uniref:Transposase IS200 like protein n=2 Tax=Stratiformator vulcanicus TaxID=2527980 RepID=A0A517R6N3_9PLAN|nr:Transposase IS200 like protein [Stratiformator vulcanicus]